ncbi:RimJ/RimL family protein N-acetyltransferase [Pontibacter ummariensis]|uniref:Protein N-acetyltransferase, RimJ/RimL family n=1 Tax=Pontibacter ummariensis TaxID=1610492 RepID=A0A239GZ19_9BACT|nr:GNAT family protein [Pontibacter ummariensis]PRY10957.1 RimJ/RimL family protein N-acetyltransferase [Pontibacter ummariensis]SNS74387.1 Protein N-acetyltransferase, RimJ/RimL family [Pontibacter ummariensis]
MNRDNLSVRELQEQDITPITRYWLSADSTYLKGMGADINKMPTEDEWAAMLLEQLRTPITEKKSYGIIWEVDGQAVGHSNVNKIVFGEEAYMHLHLWNAGTRKQGNGTALIKLTLPYFFHNLKLKTLYCEPYALNPAPNKTLEKVGFAFVDSYVTTPGWINFEQEVNLWKLSYTNFEKIAQSQQRQETPQL